MPTPTLNHLKEGINKTDHTGLIPFAKNKVRSISLKTTVMKKLLLTTGSIVILGMLPFISFAQVNIHGRLHDRSTNLPISEANVVLKNGTRGTKTDSTGNFRIYVPSLPAILVVSHQGFEIKEIIIHKEEAGPVIMLEPVWKNLDPVILNHIDARFTGKGSNSPFTYVGIGPKEITLSPTNSPYDLSKYKTGVDQTNSSFLFGTISTGGFNANGSTRVTQRVDGMDNQAPGMVFPIGNFAGPTDLDLASIELLPGPSSALFGAGGMLGTYLFNTKSPSKYQGFSLQLKQGLMHVDKRQRGKASPFLDYSFRWARILNDKWSFKISGQYITAKDWLANDSSNYHRQGTVGNIKSGTRETDPNYDGVNVYGDETSIGGDGIKSIFIGGANIMKAMNSGIIPKIDSLITIDIPNLSAVSRTGYHEKDLIDPETRNIKLSAAIHHRINKKLEAILSGNWATGNTVYTDDNRYAFKGIKLSQFRFELKHDDWFWRTYTTQENAGEAYSATIAAQYLNEAWKMSFDKNDLGNFGNFWYGQYAMAYWSARLARADVTTAHQQARKVADTGRPGPGSAEFKQIFDQVRKIPIPDGGLFKEKSQMWLSEAQYKFNKIKFADIVIGGNYKKYILDSDGTIFIDTINAIGINEIGAYAQISKAFFQDVLHLTLSGRYDKNENFKGQFSPRIAAFIKLKKDDKNFQNIRLGYQTAYRFPGNLAQWIRMDVGGDFLLLGGLPWVMDYMNTEKYPVHQILKDGRIDPNPYEYKEFKPETVRSFEIGYKGLFGNSLLVDAYAYSRRFKDFVGRIGLYQPGTGKAYSIVVNSDNEVTTTGFGIGLDYRFKKNYFGSFNFSSDIIKDVPAGFKSYFNAPKYRVNAGFGNSGMGKKKVVSYNILMRWQDAFEWEGELANGPLSAFFTIDAQITCDLPKLKSSVRLGGTNITNRYYQTGFGMPKIGGVYYLSYLFKL